MQRLQPELNRVYITKDFGIKGIKAKAFNGYPYLEGKATKFGTVNRFALEIDGGCLMLITKSEDIDKVEEYLKNVELTKADFKGLSMQPKPTKFLYGD